MQYVAAVCGKGVEVDKVKEQLLQSNPVLEGKISMYPVIFPVFTLVNRFAYSLLSDFILVLVIS